MRKGRAAWLWVHRWIGLTAGLILVLIGLTGSVIVFYRDIDRILYPQLYAAPVGEARVTLDRALATARAADSHEVTNVHIPDHRWNAWVFSHKYDDPVWGGYSWHTVIDPSTGDVRGRRNYSHGLAFTIYRLHYTLLLRPWWGEELIGVVGVLIFLSSLSGLYLWWPAPGRFGQSITLKRGASPHRRWVDWHNMLGFWGALALAVLSFTGVAIIFPEIVRPIVRVMFASPVSEDPLKRQAPLRDAPRISAEAALTAARSAVPWAELTSINFPSKERNSWQFALRIKGADSMVRSRGAVWIDPYGGSVLHEQSGRTMTMGDRAMREMLWVHNGAVAGLTGRLLIFALGFVPLIMFISGFAMWRKRNRAKRYRRSAARRPSAGTLIPAE